MLRYLRLITLDQRVLLLTNSIRVEVDGTDGEINGGDERTRKVIEEEQKIKEKEKEKEKEMERKIR